MSIAPPGLAAFSNGSRGGVLRTCPWLPSGRAFGATWLPSGRASGATARLPGEVRILMPSLEQIKSRPQFYPWTAFGELLGLGLRLTVCNPQKGGALCSKTTEPES
jgi:hypothetical protein